MMNFENTDAAAKSEYDVLILGGGIVGCCAALLIRQNLPNLSVAILDQGGFGAANLIRSPDWGYESGGIWDEAWRVSALGISSRAIFQSIGLWEKICQSGITPYHDMSLSDADGTGHLSLSAQTSGEAVLGYIVENNAMLMHLRQACQDDPLIDCLADLKVTTFVTNQCGRESQVYAFEKNTGECFQYSASLVVCAQGRHSIVRDQLALPTVYRPYAQQALVCQVKMSRPHRWVAWQNFLDTGPVAFLPLSDRAGFDPMDEVRWPVAEETEQYCSIVWSLDDDKAQVLLSEHSDVLPSLMCEKLSALAPEALGQVERCSEVRAFPLSGFMSKKLQVGGCVLVGDCAHGYHPMAGQGLNIGLLDVAVLIDQLAHSQEQYDCFYHSVGLRRFERHRKPHQLAVFELTNFLHGLYSVDVWWARLGRNVGLNLIDQIKTFKNLMVGVANAHKHYLPERYHSNVQMMPF